MQILHLGHKNFVLNITSSVEPQTYAQVVQHEVWKKAMQEEIWVLESNKTWQLVSYWLQIGCIK